MSSKVSLYYGVLLMIIVLPHQPKEPNEGNGPLEIICEYETRQLCPECFNGQSECRHADQLFEELHGSWFNKINNLMHAHSTVLGTFRGTERAVMKTLNRHKVVESLQRAFCDMVLLQEIPASGASAVCNWFLTGNSKDSAMFLKTDILDTSRIEGCIFCPASGNLASLHRFLDAINLDRTTELWKLLAVRTNVEPLLLMLASKHQVSMLFPKLLDYFGFSFIESYDGEPLSKFYSSPLHLRMLIACELIKAAITTTEGIDGFRFILTDLSPDNIAVSLEEDHKAVSLSIVDLNNVIVIDSRATTFGSDRQHLHSKIECDGCFAYSQHDVCSHRTSDLNYFAICQEQYQSKLAASQCGARIPLSPNTQATIEKHLPGLPSKRLLMQQASKKATEKRDVGCITEVCSSENLPEVEIFSLLEEQIPRYKIRADTTTTFGGYENQDWFVQYPTLPIPTEGLGLTVEQTREVLNYFLLCGNRVSQMTRTYDDIDAVTRLLEEKEKDLELTVQIGKELLAQNTQLENRVTELEQELRSTNENLAQLSHELHQKNELIGILTNDADDSSENVTPTASKSINLELLQRKVKQLEDENRSLRTEAAQLVQETDECEEQERKLMADIANQLTTANSEFDGLNLELERLKEENRLQHEQIISLTSRLAEAEIRLHQVTSENEEASSLLCITKENQNLLAGELAEFKVRYQEVLSLLQETQEQLRRQRKRSQPLARSSLIPGITMPAAPDSLQCELMETSLYSEHSLDSGIESVRGVGLGGGSQTAVPSYRKVFETVRSATRANPNGFSDSFGSTLGSMTMSSSSQPRMAPYVYPGLGSSAMGNSQSSSSAAAAPTTLTHAYKGGSSLYSTMYAGGATSSLGGRSYSRESLATDSEDGYPGPAQTGIPGAPGAKDLEAALKRLTPAEVLARRAMLQHAPLGTYSYDEQPSGMPLGCRTPDSIMSTGSSGLSGLSSTQWRLPEKLQIVKPIEGSQTLHHWSRLATPTLSGLLEERPGVTIRGGRGLDELGLQTYSLSDVEEDEEEQPGKRFQSFGCTYTYTNSTVLHPDDGTTAVTFSLPPSQMSSQMASECPSRQPTAPSTPRSSLSRRNSCSTFSVNLGLASMLNERGIKAVTPSALNTPAGPNFSPTVTPCNSPDGSPTRSMSPEPPLLSGLLASGADILRKRFAAANSADSEGTSSGIATNASGSGVPGDRSARIITRNKVALSRLEKKALRSIKIMEKVESIGLENIMLPAQHPPGISPLALHGSSALYTSTGHGRSPMAQLTSLKHLQDQRRKQQQQQQQQQDELLIDKETIKAVLTKGLSHDSLKSMASSGISSSADMSSSSSGYSDSDNSSVASDQSEQVHRVTKDSSATVSAAAAPSSSSPTTAARLKQMQRQKSRRNLLNGANGGSQRPDLGTVNGSSGSRVPGVRPDLGTVGGGKSNSTTKQTSAAGNGKIGSGAKDHRRSEQQQQQPPVKEESRSLGQSVYGTISSLLFGRKGGLL